MQPIGVRTESSRADNKPWRNSNRGSRGKREMAWQLEIWRRDRREERNEVCTDIKVTAEQCEADRTGGIALERGS